MFGFRWTGPQHRNLAQPSLNLVLLLKKNITKSLDLSIWDYRIRYFFFKWMINGSNMHNV